MIYYCCKGITPLKVGISKIIFEENQRNDNITDKQNLFLGNYISYNTKTSKSQRSLKNSESKKIKGNFPPKKVKAKKIKNDSFDNKNNKQTDDVKLIDIVKKRKKMTNKRAKFKDKESVNSDKFRKRKSIVDYMDENAEKNKNKNGKDKSGIEVYKKSILSDKSEKLNNPEKTLDKLNEEKKVLDNYELNNLNYDDAYELDKRTCCKTYWSVLKREHYVLFTFLSWNDYNLFYVKIERFLF